MAVLPSLRTRSLLRPGSLVHQGVQLKPKAVVERYQNETRRVISVLESVLCGQEWLVGGKLSVADIAFLQWNTSADRITLGNGFIDKEAPPCPEMDERNDRQARDQ